MVRLYLKKPQIKLNGFNNELKKLQDSGELLKILQEFGFTEEELPGTFEGKFRIDLPSKQYMLLRLTKVEA